MNTPVRQPHNIIILHSSFIIAWIRPVSLAGTLIYLFASFDSINWSIQSVFLKSLWLFTRGFAPMLLAIIRSVSSILILSVAADYDRLLTPTTLLLRQLAQQFSFTTIHIFALSFSIAVAFLLLLMRWGSTLFSSILNFSSSEALHPRLALGLQFFRGAHLDVCLHGAKSLHPFLLLCFHRLLCFDTKSLLALLDSWLFDLFSDNAKSFSSFHLFALLFFDQLKCLDGRSGSALEETSSHLGFGSATAESRETQLLALLGWELAHLTNFVLGRSCSSWSSWTASLLGCLACTNINQLIWSCRVCARCLSGSLWLRCVSRCRRWWSDSLWLLRSFCSCWTGLLWFARVDFGAWCSSILVRLLCRCGLVLRDNLLGLGCLFLNLRVDTLGEPALVCDSGSLSLSCGSTLGISIGFSCSGLCSRGSGFGLCCGCRFFFGSSGSSFVYKRWKLFKHYVYQRGKTYLWRRHLSWQLSWEAF